MCVTLLGNLLMGHASTYSDVIQNDRNETVTEVTKVPLPDRDSYSWSVCPQSSPSLDHVENREQSADSESLLPPKSLLFDTAEIIIRPQVERKTKKTHPWTSSLPLLTSKNQTLSRSSKLVTFSTIEVREYAVIVGDHPCCRDTLPITLDWSYNPDSAVVKMEDESFEPSYQRPCKLTYVERLKRLEEVAGVPSSELVDMALRQRNNNKLNTTTSNTDRFIHHIYSYFDYPQNILARE